jgi:ribonuclease P/MRP protein subunit RPP1
MRKFADLNLRPSVGDLNHLEKMIGKSYELGYRLVGVSLPPNIRQDEVKLLEKICGSIGVDLVTRIDLTPKRSEELLRELRRLRLKFGVISVMCDSKPVARQAAKDRRVDLLSFSTDSRRRFFDKAEAELASQGLASLEISMAPLLSLRGESRTRLFSRLRKEVKTAEKFNIPIVVSSGAIDEYLLRTPHDYAAFATLFDLDKPLGLRALSQNPLGIVKRNREKLSPNYVALGVRVVKREKNC